MMSWWMIKFEMLECIKYQIQHKVRHNLDFFFYAQLFIMLLSVCQCLLDSSPSSSLLVRSSTSSTLPNLPNRSFKSFSVTVWLNPPMYSRRIALYQRQHCHCTDTKQQCHLCLSAHLLIHQHTMISWSNISSDQILNNIKSFLTLLFKIVSKSFHVKSEYLLYLRGPSFSARIHLCSILCILGVKKYFMFILEAIVCTALYWVPYCAKLWGTLNVNIIIQQAKPSLIVL